MPALHFQKVGQGPTLVLSHALGCDLGMWDEVVQRLQARYTVIRYDHRGHGSSPCHAETFAIEDMADDAAELIGQVADQPVHFVGLSMGGMVAQALAVRHPHLVRSMVIANSASHYDDAARSLWQARVQSVRQHGMEAIADGALQRWFTPSFLNDPLLGHQRTQAMRRTLVRTPSAFYAASCEAVAGIDFRQSNRHVRQPTLVVAGSEDLATPPMLSEVMANAIPESRLSVLNTAHLSAVEQPDAFAELVLQFLPTVQH